MRRRSQAASKAYSPAFTSFASSSSAEASRASTIRSTEPNSLRTTRPSSPGSAAKTDASVIAASSSRRCSMIATSWSAEDERHVARQDEDLLHAVSQVREGSAHGIARPARHVLEREAAALADDIPDRLGRGRVDDDRGRRAHARGVQLGRGFLPRVEDVREHRPAAQRVEDLGCSRVHARAKARGEDDRSRPARRLGPGRGHAGILGGLGEGVKRRSGAAAHCDRPRSRRWRPSGARRRRTSSGRAAGPA